MKNLQERYAVSNIVTRVQLQTKLSRMAYENQPMADFIDGYEEAFNRLAAMDSPVAEELQVAMLLSAFGDKNKSPFGQVVTSLQTMSGIVPWEVTNARLLQEYEENRLENRHHNGQDPRKDHGAAISVGNVRRYQHGKGHHQRGRKFVERRRCYICNKRGHLARDHDKHSNESSEQSIYGDTANSARMMMAIGPVSRRNDELLLDSAVSDHMVIDSV